MGSNPLLAGLVIATEIAGGGPEDPLADLAALEEIEAFEALEAGETLGLAEASPAAEAVAEQVSASEAGEIEATGTNTVYQSFDSAGNVNYVGITNNFARRSVEQAGNGISISEIPGLAGNLSRADARAVEQ